MMYEKKIFSITNSGYKLRLGGGGGGNTISIILSKHVIINYSDMMMAPDLLPSQSVSSSLVRPHMSAPFTH